MRQRVADDFLSPVISGLPLHLETAVARLWSWIYTKQCNAMQWQFLAGFNAITWWVGIESLTMRIYNTLFPVYCAKCKTFDSRLGTTDPLRVWQNVWLNTLIVQNLDSKITPERPQIISNHTRVPTSCIWNILYYWARPNNFSSLAHTPTTLPQTEEKPPHF